MTDDELRSLLAEAKGNARYFGENPQYSGGIVALLCEEVLLLRAQLASEDVTPVS